jgi:hypothetical protein
MSTGPPPHLLAPLSMIVRDPCHIGSCHLSGISPGVDFVAYCELVFQMAGPGSHKTIFD